ncbi:unnamed protein product [Owenia fusiformis]|uniref:Uncharacterized protein n=1 Tax=Owenia fusiformis TaxID=6347 RepID=A0A8J1U699_OWEFU|nr:unnamed protein product [Owenia fusiformis]
MPVIPIINKDMNVVMEMIKDKIAEPKSQRKIVLVIVCIALLLDNMLYMVIVPIIPAFLRDINAFEKSSTEIEATSTPAPTSSSSAWNETYTSSWINFTSSPKKITPLVDYSAAEDTSVGILFASKAIVQLLVNPCSGAIIDRIGYDYPMVIGLTIIFFSTTIFAFAKSFLTLFVARGLQGVGSAFADTSGLAMIADRYTDKAERTKALGIALAFISFGCLFAPPFGGVLYQFAGKEVPFVLLAVLALLDGILLLVVMKPVRQQRKEMKQSGNLPKGTPIWRLFIDPYITIAAGALAMANVSLAFLEPTIAIWMKQTMDADEWQMGFIWLPAFFPHVLGVYLTVRLASKYPKYQWLMAAIGLALEGLSCLIVPFATNFGVLVIPLMTICFGIALVDTALLPTMAYLVDVRHVSVYGSIYAIADISYSLAYAFGPIVAGGIVSSIGFTALNIGICVSNVVFAPILIGLRHIYDYAPFKNEEDILIDGETPKPSYKTYMMNDEYGSGQKEINTQEPNHLAYKSSHTDDSEDSDEVIDTNLQTVNDNQPHDPWNAPQQPVRSPNNPFRPHENSNNDYQGFR